MREYFMPFVHHPQTARLMLHVHSLPCLNSLRTSIPAQTIARFWCISCIADSQFVTDWIEPVSQ
jgi:hypothetical protein